MEKKCRLNSCTKLYFQILTCSFLHYVNNLSIYCVRLLFKTLVCWCVRLQCVRLLYRLFLVLDYYIGYFLCQTSLPATFCIRLLYQLLLMLDYYTGYFLYKATCLITSCVKLLYSLPIALGYCTGCFFYYTVGYFLYQVTVLSHSWHSSYIHLGWYCFFLVLGVSGGSYLQQDSCSAG